MSHSTAHGLAVITGASSGIGRATALLFAGKGWPAGLIGRNGTGPLRRRVRVA